MILIPFQHLRRFRCRYHILQHKLQAKGTLAPPVSGLLGGPREELGDVDFWSKDGFVEGSAALLRSWCKFPLEEASVHSNPRFSQSLNPIYVWVRLDSRQPERGEAACAPLRIGCTLFLSSHAAQTICLLHRKYHFLPTITQQYRFMC